MGNGMIHSSGTGFVGLLAGLVEDLRTLFKQELQLLRHEIQEEVSKVRRAALSVGVGIGFAAVGGIFLLSMLVHMLFSWTGLPLWACYGIVGGILMVAAGWLIMKAMRTLAGVRAVPARTLHSMKEDAQWIKHQVISSKT